MAQAYFQSIKLPNLLHIPHPSSRVVQKPELNIEGTNAATTVSSDNVNLKFNARNNNSNENEMKRCRSSYIANIIDDENKRKQENKRSAKITADEMMDLINEKLTTGYHGVRHLFKANNPHRKGILNRESFKHVINSLCGYIPPDEWGKVVRSFQLDKNETISFETFISYFFDKNEKVRKEILNANQRVEMFDLNGATVSPDEVYKKTPQLSATYCLSVLKSKARSRDFDPTKFLPKECLENRSLILPYHLYKVLEICNLKLSDYEFKKLWERFDVDNIGGIRTKVFLRLINYNPNELDELSANVDRLRTKSCIVHGLNNKARKTLLGNPNKHSYFINLNNNPVKNETNNDTNRVNSVRQSAIPKSAKSVASNNVQQEVDNKNNENNEAVKDKNETNNNQKFEVVNSENVTKNEEKVETTNKNNNDIFVDYYNQKPISGRKGTSFSESKVKYMVQRFKSSLQLKQKDNLITFLNNKFNAGYISLRTAFEYVDPDNYGYLLKNEFEAVLKEFEIEFKPNEYEKFLKSHGFMKRNTLVNYKSFLILFHDHSENSLTQEILKDLKSYMKSEENTVLTAKEANFKLINFFHGFYLATLNFFKETLGDKQICNVETLKSLLEKALSVKISEEQIQSLLKFLKLEEKENEIEWIEFFKKFNEIE